jgi:hypothetical protein
MTDTTIQIGTISIHEPVTAFTDYIITILSLFFYFQLKKKSTNRIIKYWGLFFGLLGMSTFFGACAHAFFQVHEGVAYKSFWLTMQIVNGFALYCAQQATLYSVLVNSKYVHRWKISYIIQLLLFIIALFCFQKYLVTIIANAVTLIPIMVLHFNSKVKESYQKKIAYGILISFITAIVHGLKFSLHDYFNYNDIAHVFIMISLFVMYKGATEKAISLQLN